MQQLNLSHLSYFLSLPGSHQTLLIQRYSRCCNIIWSLVHPLPLAHFLCKQTNVEILSFWKLFDFVREESLAIRENARSMRGRTEYREAPGVPVGWGWWNRKGLLLQTGHSPSLQDKEGSESPPGPTPVSLPAGSLSQPCARTCSALLLITTSWEPIPVQFCSLSAQFNLSRDRK